MTSEYYNSEVLTMNSNTLEMVYVTKFKFEQILKYDSEIISQLNLNESDLPGKVGSIIRDGKKTMLSQAENRWLLCAKVMYENFDIYVDKVYKKYQNNKPKKYIFEINKPKYHINCSCNKLNSKLENPYLIPKELDEDKQDDFCIWFMENQKRFEKDLNSYIREIFDKFGIKCNSLPEKDLTKDNSGTKSILNASQEQLIARIDQLIDEALIFYKRDSQTRKIIDSYGDQTNNIKKDLAQEDFNILTNWHNRKQELKSRVLDYFHLRFNSSLKFDKKLIIEVGFEPCKVCIKNAENL